MHRFWLFIPDQRRRVVSHRKREPIRRRDDGDETLAEIGRGYNVSHSTISRLKA
jgi:IS30 family transposase